MSALAPSLVLEAIREMSAQERCELRELLTAAMPVQRDETTLLTVQAAARYAACHVETIRRAIRSRALRASQVGPTWRVAESDLKAWMSVPPATPSTNDSNRPRQQHRRPAPEFVEAAFAAARKRSARA